jgi:hypothetical protein
MIAPLLASSSAGILAKFVSEFQDWKMRRREAFWDCIQKGELPSVCYRKVQSKYPMPNKLVVYSIVFGLAGMSLLGLFSELSKEFQKEGK